MRQWSGQDIAALRSFVDLRIEHSAQARVVRDYLE